MLKIVAFSDTHGLHNRVTLPPCDIAIFAGDFSNYGEKTVIKDFLFWYGLQPAKNKIYIAGNHDISYQDDTTFKLKVIKKFHDINYLEDSEIVVCGLKIYGSPWTPRFGHWAFMLDEHDLEKKYQMIPGDTNILITHGPTLGVLDKTISGKPAGSRALARRLASINHTMNLKLHIFGHIHEAAGIWNAPHNSIKSINASLVNVDLQLTNEPTVIEI